LGLNEESARALSPALIDLEALPDSIICWGENETGEFKRQSVEFARAQIDAGGKCNYFEVAGRNHFDLVYELDNIRIEPGGMTMDIHQ